MSGFFGSFAGGPGDGIFPTEFSRPMWNRAGAALLKGDIVMVDLAASATEVDGTSASAFVPGSSDGSTVWSVVVDPDAAGLKSGVLGVVTQDGGIADNARGSVQFFGIVDAFVIDDTDNINPGDQLVGTTANNLDGVVATDERVLATSIAPVLTTPTTRTLSRVFFNGLGFTVNTN